MSKRKFEIGDPVRVIHPRYDDNWRNYAHRNSKGVIVDYIPGTSRPYVVKVKLEHLDDTLFHFKPTGIQKVVHTYYIISQPTFKGVDEAIALAEKAADKLKAPIQVQDAHIQDW